MTKVVMVFQLAEEVANAGTTDSHFISIAFILGCETSKCQITAWNDSV